MTVVPETESALEFLATCAARLVTTWEGTLGRLTLHFQSGVITCEDDGAGHSWSGKLTVSGRLTLTRRNLSGASNSLTLSGTYDRAHNAVDGTMSSSSSASSDSFHLALLVPDIQMTVEQEEKKMASQRKDALEEYQEQRGKVMHVRLGEDAQADVVTTWTALYVYGSGRSDTIKDVLIRVVGHELSGGGSDSQGEYSWSGTVAADGSFSLVKAYAGAHSIQHVGTYSARTNSVKGTWSIVGTRASGGFQMTESVSRRINGQAMSGSAEPGAAEPEVRPFGVDGPLSAKDVADTVWSVVYVYASGRSDELRDCTLRFIRGRISGSGEDNLGPFRWSGSVDASGACVLDKEYIGQHTVRHEGSLSGEMIKGSWSVPNTRAVGGFHMTEKTPMRRTVPAKLVEPLGDGRDPVIVTIDIDYCYGSGKAEQARGIQLRVKGGKVSGRGADGLGDCEWSGEIRPGKGAVEIVKHYPGKHDIVHTGDYDPETGIVKGSWNIPGSDVNGTFTLEERLAERRLPTSATAQSAGAGAGAAAIIGSKGGARGVAVPSMETANMDRVQALPPLHTVKDEVVTSWKGAQIIGTSQEVPFELTLSFGPGDPHVIISGKGTDEDAGGSFTVKGTLDPSSYAVVMEKKYTTHAVAFSGSYSPDESAIRGKWDMTVMKAKGEFELIELPEKRLG